MTTKNKNLNKNLQIDFGTIPVRNIDLRNKQILIAYGSKYGSTITIAERIGKILKEKGAHLEIINLNEQKRNFTIALDRFAGIIIGSAIYAGKWTPKIKKFIKKSRSTLSQIPLAAFAVCGEVHDLSRKEIGLKKYVENYLKHWSISPDFGAVFAGVLDLSKESPYRKLEQTIVRHINKTDPTVVLNARNDYRNWEKIDEFARNFAYLLPFIMESKKFQTTDI